MDWLTFAGAICGGALGAAASVTLTTSRRQRRHLALVRAAEAHEHARTELGPLAASVFRWADAISYKTRGADLGFYDPEGDHPTLSPAGPLSALRTIRSTHPTAQVRSAAKSLFEQITTCYAEPDPNTVDQFPDRLEDWDRIDANRRAAEALVELIQTPPTS